MKAVSHPRDTITPFTGAAKTPSAYPYRTFIVIPGPEGDRLMPVHPVPQRTTERKAA